MVPSDANLLFLAENTVTNGCCATENPLGRDNGPSLRLMCLLLAFALKFLKALRRNADARSELLRVQ